MEEVKAKKETYVKGLWNVNVVSMGGLGKFPDQGKAPNLLAIIESACVISRQFVFSTGSKFTFAFPFPIFVRFSFWSGI